MSDSNQEADQALTIVGKVSKSEVLSLNGPQGPEWVRGIKVAEKTVKTDFPSVSAMLIAGGKAHQSRDVQAHSNVISVKFYDGDERKVVSGHVHMDGRIEYNKKLPGGGLKSTWKPTREQVNQAKWTIYDTDKKKQRKVTTEGKWWYIEIEGCKVPF
ncbi:uncharacterized protein BBA_03914 [Beauveria bassiana ARSEF 2860]|uniref:Uncharacterized protein n=1 Tax=Beauveria bassiana (strain ARSEF 2860) TaxID=655819 RepID=J4WB38_BEAB2|nr:uncharacterized protein BBA_03914 [Beauveria bassiana ARSEF 2860]EJP67340.1 hypothetical protein BBA_03914 [Beauveria bassiana ARSEF 2860]